VNTEPNPNHLPPAVGKPSVALFVRGRWSILFVGAYLSLATIVFFFLLCRSVDRWSHGRVSLILVVPDLSATVGGVILGAMVWRYAAAVRRFNLEGEPATQLLESAHAKLWRWAAVLLAIQLVITAIAVTRPAIQPNANDELPPTQNHEP